MLRDSSETKNYWSDLSNLTKNPKSTNLSETIDFPSESSNHYFDKVLTSIGFIGSFLHGKLTSSMIVQKLKISSKTKNYERYGPAKYDDKIEIVKPVQKLPYYFIQ